MVHFFFIFHTLSFELNFSFDRSFPLNSFKTEKRFSIMKIKLFLKIF